MPTKFNNGTLIAKNIGASGFECVVDPDTENELIFYPLRSSVMNSGYEVNIQCNSDILSSFIGDTISEIKQKLDEFIIIPASKLRPEAIKNIVDFISSFLKGILKGVGKATGDLADLVKYLTNLGDNLRNTIKSIIKIFQDPSSICSLFLNQTVNFRFMSIPELSEFVGEQAGYLATNVLVGYFTGSWISAISKNLPEITSKVLAATASKVKGLNIVTKLGKISLAFIPGIKFKVYNMFGKGLLKASDVVENLTKISNDGFAKFAKYLNLSTEISLLKKYCEFIKIVKEVDSKMTRFTQNSVKAENYEWVLTTLETKKWDTDILSPLDVVKMKDGKLTSLDNKRLLAAKNLKINAKVIIHEYDELMPDSFRYYKDANGNSVNTPKFQTLFSLL